MFTRSQVTLGDGTRLSYIDEGSGHPLLIMPGLSSSVAKFEKQVVGLKPRYRVIALDPRGHGESDSPATGYNFHRMARDLHEVLEHLDLDEVALLGHSAACKTILTYLELYDTKRVRCLILSDDAPACVSDGAFTYEEAAETLAKLEGPDAVAHTRAFAEMFLTDEADAETRRFFLDETLKMPRAAHAKLLRWALFGDWWDAIKLVDMPTLVIGGRVSKNPWQNMERMHRMIPESRLVIFEAHEGGAHSMYWENPEKYNAEVDQFLTACWPAE